MATNTVYCRGCHQRVLTTREWNTIRRALEVAAAVYHQDTCANRGVSERVAEAFFVQERDCLALTEKLGEVV